MKKVIEKWSRYLLNNKGFGMYEIIGIAAVLLVAAFVIIPGFRSFSEGMMSDMKTWFSNTISTSIFPVS